jgi:hypothetical protein
VCLFFAKDSLMYKQVLEKLNHTLSILHVTADTSPSSWKATYMALSRVIGHIEVTGPRAIFTLQRLGR